ncbi:MAG: TolC family protein [Nitrospirae bacterium]|nr:TolC family protein [Nitrospirota bacterium]
MKYYLISAIILLLVLITPFEAVADELINKGDSINLEKCMEIALLRHPGIIASKNTVNANQGRIGQASANYYPQLNWSAGYKRLSAESKTTPSGTNTADTNQYTSSLSLNQNIYDFGKTSSQVTIQELNLESSRSDLENISEQVLLNVKKSYYGVLQARRNRGVANETVKQFEQHLEQAKGFYEVGTKPRFDVTKAEVDLSNARLGLIKSENALKIAVANLNNAIGLPDAPEYSIEDNLTFQSFPITFEEALSEAYKYRPDIRSISAKVRAAEYSIDLTEKGFYPLITGNAAYNWTGESLGSINDNKSWNIGATLSFPIFSGYSTTYQVEESSANLSVLKANEELLRQNVFLEVQQAYLNLHEAGERIPAAELTVRQAEENRDIAKGRYDAGVGSPIEVTDAETVLTNAKTTYIQALYDYKISQANIEKAMGKSRSKKLDDRS